MGERVGHNESDMMSHAPIWSRWSRSFPVRQLIGLSGVGQFELDAVWVVAEEGVAGVGRVLGNAGDDFGPALAVGQDDGEAVEPGDVLARDPLAVALPDVHA